MSDVKVLIDAVTATDATKRLFSLSSTNFKGGSVPALRSTGLGVGDDVNLWVYVNGTAVDLGSVLDDTVSTYPIPTMGEYAVTVTMTTAGPATCILNCYRAN